MLHEPASRLKRLEPHFLNRELSLLAFNRRVLAQAEDRRTPMLERLRFLCIVSSNMDEFFEIRVAELKERIKLGGDMDHRGEGPATEIFRIVSERAHTMVVEQYRVLNEEILPGLAEEGVCFLNEPEWTREQRRWLHDYFVREMMPVMTPIGLDPAHPFPRVLNKSLNLAVQLEGRDAFGRNSGRAIVQAPRLLPRVMALPPQLTGGKTYHFVHLSVVLRAFVSALFQGMIVNGAYPFRVTRNSDLFVDEEEIKDLRTALAGELPQRHFGDSVRLEVAESCPPQMTDFLLQQFELTEEDLYRVDGPVNLVRLMNVPDIVDLPSLKFGPFLPGTPKTLGKHGDIFRSVRKGDILLHHPFQSFSPVIEMLEQAAEDPNVVAIRQTVYRTGTDSVIMKYLIDAAQRGKEVTVVVELLARFDEEANIQYAAKLEEVGAHVIYGVVGYKTHAKMLLVVRREDGTLRRYAHLSTGNYHPRTAKQYTDFGLLTANEEICIDVDAVFKQLTGLGRARSLNHLWVSPFTLHERTITAIKREIRHAKAGKPAHVIAKMNSLLEPRVIEALYAASQAGVKVDLIVRGVCALRPGIPGLSEHIRVRSIIGRFLEHTRIFYFLNDGAEDVHLSSADWMERNFFRRIELCFPLLDARLKQRVIKEGLKVYLADNNQAWDMDSDGNYHRRHSHGRVPRPAQEQLLALLSAR
ncbi:MAG: RNA degradosome polyphosphate kinase [Betaproteobacteria bacterium RIFCSPLOWO2_12_FULL_65_110]|nr:MAG: RNA degradosome polyphosphate kinase [Betaproteobacteria bacterium RIFCSPLOWO2_12_FULL_65_110]